MKTYELTYIVSPETTSEEAAAKAKEIESIIQGKEGVILKQSNPMPKTLSYPIKKRASGFFGVLEFQLEPEKLIELKEIVAKDGKIVRHMVIIKEAAKPRKERRSQRVLRAKSIPAFEIKQKTEIEEPIRRSKKEKPASAKIHKGTAGGKEKVELKDIEQKLDELLNE
jgi:ribosomal protein S6